MVRTIFLKFVIVSILLVSNLAVFAQELTLNGVLKGSQWKSKILAAEIPDGWKAVKIGLNGQQNGFESLMPMLLMSGGSGGSEGNLVMKILKLAEISWTDGEWHAIDGDQYLVTYRLDLTVPDLVSIHGPSSMPPIPLVLQLIRKSAISTLNPQPDFTKEEFVKAFAPIGSQEGDIDLSAKKTATLSNLKQISLGMLMYSADYDDVFPYVQGTEAARFVTYPYIKNIAIWRSLNPNSSEFVINRAIAGVEQSEIPNPAETVMYYETAQWPDGSRAVAFVDGHVKFLDPEAWAQATRTITLTLKKKGKPLPMSYGIGKLPLPRSGATPPPH